MSGPKVVRIVTREEIEAICRREIAIAEAAAGALRQAHRRHGGLGAETERAIAESAQRLADLFGAERHLDVQKQAPQMAAFFRSETERVEREAVAAAEAARSRRRRIADAARSVCAALEAAGRPVAELLRGVTARALVATEHELDDLQAVIDAGFRGLVAASRPGGGDVSTGMHAETQALAARLGAQETPDTLAAWLARQTPAPSPADARLDTALAAVEALGDAELAATYTARAAALDGVGGDRRALLLDSLLFDASRDAKRLRDAGELRARLCEAAAGLDALGTQAALALAARISAGPAGRSGKRGHGTSSCRGGHGCRTRDVRDRRRRAPARRARRLGRARLRGARGHGDRVGTRRPASHPQAGHGGLRRRTRSARGCLTDAGPPCRRRPALGPAECRTRSRPGGFLVRRLRASARHPVRGWRRHRHRPRGRGRRPAGEDCGVPEQRE